MYQTRLELWEAEQTMKWAWRFLMSKNHHEYAQQISVIALALQAMTKLRLDLYPDPSERNNE